jgi:hypothetical protein
MLVDQAPIYNLGRFTDLHDNWQCLETLVLCRTNVSSAVMGPGIIATIANRLPSLKHLMISNFSKEDFHNGTLLSLKPLQSLRLENLDGITDQGLNQLADSPAAACLPNLRTLKAPSDPDGELQALCRPIPRSALTTSDVEFLGRFDPGSRVRSLRLSRLQARLRVRESRRRTSVGVAVSDETEQTRNTQVIGSYLGDIASEIEYSLEPDVEVREEEEALASLGDVNAGRRFEVLF